MARMDKSINLIAFTESETEVDELGNPLLEESTRTIQAEELSPGQREFFSAGETGLKASKVFKAWACEYQNEEDLEFEGTRFHIYRNYVKGNHVELYCEVRASGN